MAKIIIIYVLYTKVKKYSLYILSDILSKWSGNVCKYQNILKQALYYTAEIIKILMLKNNLITTFNNECLLYQEQKKVTLYILSQSKNYFQGEEPDNMKGNQPQQNVCITNTLVEVGLILKMIIMMNNRNGYS